MGAVYRAFDTELDRTVALKVVRPELAVNPQAMTRFKQELLLASRISHRNILRIHDLGESEGTKFITMAFVEGMDLAQLIDRTGALPIERALAFGKQLFAALEAAHGEGVVHRDLKPQNVLVDGADNLYVSDFGLAKSFEAEISAGTRTGQLLGTPRYMSPEQVEAKDVDQRSDLYSAGLILSEMLTGELPFRGESAMQLMYQRVSEAPCDPRKARPELPDYLARIILKCLEKDPRNRYQSAREVLDDLDAQRAPAAKAGEKTISFRVRRPTRRATVTALGLAGGILAALTTIPQTRQAVRGWMTGTGAPQGIEHYIAVLPVTVVGDDGGLKYLAEGIADSLTAKLSGLHNVYVAASSALPAGAVADDAKVAKLLGVKLLVKSSLLASSQRIALTVKVQDAEQNRTILTREFSGVRKDLLTLQDQAFDAIANALLIRQTNEEKARIALRPTQDIEAYELYLQGAALIKGKRDRSTAQEALDRFEKATRIDPTFALAYAGTADACIRLWQATKDKSWTERALSAAEQAERLNPNLPQAHNSLGTAYTNMGRAAEGMAEFKRAIDLAPNSDDAWRRLGVAYLNGGRLEDAAKAFDEAVRINRYYWNNYNLVGLVNLRLGRHQKAVEAYRQVTLMKPDEARGWGNMGVALYQSGEWKECIPALEKAITLDPTYNFQLGVAYFFLRRYAEATKAFEAAVQKTPDDPSYLQSLGDAYRWSNQPKKATETYDRAIDAALGALNTDRQNTEALAILGGCYAKKGDATKALQFIRQARQIDNKNSDLMYREATIHTIAGRQNEAISSLRDALRNGYSPLEAKADPELTALRERPEFAGLLQEATRKSAK
jgi:tetratricopeptide (TPR) repeat protein